MGRGAAGWRPLDLGQALLIAEQLEFGGVGINVNDVTELASPFGGWKESGIGREMGPEGLEAYLEPKHIRIRLGAGRAYINSEDAAP